MWLEKSIFYQLRGNKIRVSHWIRTRMKKFNGISGGLLITTSPLLRLQGLGDIADRVRINISS